MVASAHVRHAELQQATHYQVRLHADSLGGVLCFPRIASNLIIYSALLSVLIVSPMTTF